MSELRIFLSIAFIALLLFPMVLRLFRRKPVINRILRNWKIGALY